MRENGDHPLSSTPLTDHNSSVLAIDDTRSVPLESSCNELHVRTTFITKKTTRKSLKNHPMSQINHTWQSSPCVDVTIFLTYGTSLPPSMASYLTNDTLSWKDEFQQPPYATHAPSTHCKSQIHELRKYDFIVNEWSYTPLQPAPLHSGEAHPKCSSPRLYYYCRWQTQPLVATSSFSVRRPAVTSHSDWVRHHYGVAHQLSRRRHHRCINLIRRHQFFGAWFWSSMIKFHKIEGTNMILHAQFYFRI